MSSVRSFFTEKIGSYAISFFYHSNAFKVDFILAISEFLGFFLRVCFVIQSKMMHTLCVINVVIDTLLIRKSPFLRNQSS